MKVKALMVVLATVIHGVAAEQSDPPGPMLDGLGKLHHEITTSSKLAQRYFDQGLRLAVGFNHREAIRSFKSAATIDPNCAMAWWGVAFASGPHVNRPMTKEDNDRAWAALQQAIAHRAAVTPKEQAYITALEKRYQAELPADRSALDKAFAAAMRELTKQYPEDLDARTFFAEALMDTMPWDYWAKDRSPKPEITEAFEAVRYVLARDPDHPGANHFYIHLLEAGPNPELGLPSADSLRDYAPAAGHLVHMPAHIYMRVGRYHDATLVNELAMKADKMYIAHCRAQGFYPGVYYPHNIHFLWWAQTFEGRSADAQRTARQAAGYAMENYCGPSKVLEAPRLRHLPWLTDLRFGRWDGVMKVAEPASTNDFLVDRAIWHFSRGLVLASRKDADGAAREQETLAKLVHSDAAKRLDEPTFPVTATLGISEQWLSGRVAEARGDRPGMIEHFEKAIAAEDAMPYMEPAYWPFPARPAFGAALLRAGDSIGAERVFREDLKRMKRNPWGLLGLEASLRAQGKTDSAGAVHALFEDSWKRADTKLDLAWF